MRPFWLGAAVLVWTLLAWGGRIGLLTDGDGVFDAVRIGGSILIGLATAAVLVFPGLRGRANLVLYGFIVWTVGLWARSLIVNWSGSGSVPFKLVHTVLAAGFLVLVVGVWSSARGRVTVQE